MSDLAAFLLARIAEDAATNDGLVREEVARCRADGMPGTTEDEIRAFWGGQAWWRRRLAECEAKRRIVQDMPFVGEHAAALLLRVGQMLALPYADHPDYDEAWRP